MKRFTFASILLILSNLVLMQGCWYFSDEDKDNACKKSKIDPAVEETYQTIFFISQTAIVAHEGDKYYYLREADEVEIQGTIRLIDCWEQESDYLNFSYMIHPKRDFIKDAFYTDFNLQAEHKWKFTNSEEYFTISFELSAFYTDRSYKTDDTYNTVRVTQYIEDDMKEIKITVFDTHVWTPLD